MECNKHGFQLQSPEMVAVRLTGSVALHKTLQTVMKLHSGDYGDYYLLRCYST
jgi:hypothetical protein